MATANNQFKEQGAPLVSVVTPVYNNERYLEQAVQSILDQTLSDFEFILVDDESTDSSAAILERMSRQDPRIRVFRRPHTGIVGAMNDGLRLARAEFIARMDADDLALPHRLERQVEFLRDHPDHVLVGSRVMLIDPDGAPICEFVHETTHEEIDQGHVAMRWTVVHPAVMYRRQVVLDLSGYRGEYESLEDLDLFLRLAERGRLANLPEVLLLYRQHPESMCVTFRDQQNDVRSSVYRDLARRRGISINFAPEQYHAPDRSLLQMMRHWGWLALKAGKLATARKYALRVLRGEPLNLESWRLLYCALRGR